MRASGALQLYTNMLKYTLPGNGTDEPQAKTR